MSDDPVMLISAQSYYAIGDPGNRGLAFRAICDFNKRWSAVRVRVLARRRPKRSKRELKNTLAAVLAMTTR
jgi:hypothetical protein